MAEPVTTLADTAASAALPVRPLPIGAFPLPFGYLLLPADAEPERELLLAGRLPTTWPERLRGYEFALVGDTAAALAAFAGNSPVQRYNRFVLDPDGADAEDLRRELGELGSLVDLVLFGVGRSDDPPALDGLDGELLALALASRAAAELDAEQLDAASATLSEAIDAAVPVFPALAGVLYGAVGQVCRQAGEAPAAIAALQAGIALLADTDLSVGCAELHLELAGLFHELAGERRDLLNQAVTHYHSALQKIDRAGQPEMFASAHTNLATAYLTMPMVEASDQLRLGVAVGSLRAALEIYTPEAYPVQWASTQLNLANALVYAPSTHQADNLAEAVELYEAVLLSRDPDTDPLGYARVLSNQGNALAHLGMFDHARGKLVEARSIFEQMQDLDATHSVRGLLDEIARVNVMSATAHHG